MMLNSKQYRFALEILIGTAPGAAAIRSGYAEKSAPMLMRRCKPFLAKSLHSARKALRRSTPPPVDLVAARLLELPSDNPVRLYLQNFPDIAFWMERLRRRTT